MLKIHPALFILLAVCIMACSNAAPDNTGSGAAPAVENAHPGEAKKDHVDVKQTDSTINPPVNNSVPSETIGTGNNNTK